jgi:glycosyltransferase involved in cell wall biosynthesis
MVNAMHILRDEAVFIMVGDGELRAGLESIIKNAGIENSVYFHEAIPSERVLDVLASADAGIVLVDTDAPSYALALPSKIYEYLFAGLPILASPMKQVIREFTGHSAIRFVKLHDEEAIITGVGELLDLTNSKDLMSKLQEEAIESYSFEHDAKHFAEFLEERIK